MGEDELQGAHADTLILRAENIQFMHGSEQ
jgi:hypothetical protein